VLSGGYLLLSNELWLSNCCLSSVLFLSLQENSDVDNPVSIRNINLTLRVGKYMHPITVSIYRNSVQYINIFRGHLLENLSKKIHF